jgi:hypothetical protein
MRRWRAILSQWLLRAFCPLDTAPTNATVGKHSW